MSANPERMRPTELSRAPIVREANVVVCEELLRARNEAIQSKDGALQRVIYLFMANKTGEPKERGGQQ